MAKIISIIILSEDLCVICLKLFRISLVSSISGQTTKENYFPYRDSILELLKKDTSTIVKIKAYKDILIKLSNHDFTEQSDSSNFNIILTDGKGYIDSLRTLTIRLWGNQQKLALKIKAITTINDSIEILRSDYSKKVDACKSLKLIGNVQEIEGKSISMFGIVVNSSCNGLYNCDDEGVPGALHQESNIVAINYSEEFKYSGTAVVGERLEITGFCYDSKTYGTNGFGANVPVYRYRPCSCLPNKSNYQKKIDLLNHKTSTLWALLGVSDSQEFSELNSLIQKISGNNYFIFISFKSIRAHKMRSRIACRERQNIWAVQTKEHFGSSANTAHNSRVMRRPEAGLGLARFSCFVQRHIACV